jgi:mevalonate kinase
MARASGKVILCGEHAVVHGCPAIAVGIDLGVEASAAPSRERALYFDDERVQDEATLRAYGSLLDTLGQNAETRVSMQLPPGVGLGASAALAVAIARAVSDLQAPQGAEDAPRLLRAAQAWETVFHDNPSGIDAACALSGGCIRFRRDRGFEPLPVKVRTELLVAVAGPPMPTRQMVESVARIQKRAPKRFADDLEAIASLVDNAAHCLAFGDLPGLGKLMDYNHLFLSSWLVSTTEIEDAIRRARDAGALGAKLTGAGGGGCVVALPSESSSGAILDAWQAAGYRCFSTSFGPGP